jgi:hypothetical protein
MCEEMVVNIKEEDFVASKPNYGKVEMIKFIIFLSLNLTMNWV